MQDIWQAHYQMLSQIIADNLAERIQKIKCKYGHDYKKFKTCGIK